MTLGGTNNTSAKNGIIGMILFIVEPTPVEDNKARASFCQVEGPANFMAAF